MNDLELARWQGMIDERTARSVERLDTINGDVREIKLSLVKIQDELKASSDSRLEWVPVLKRLATSEAVAEGITEKLKESRALGLTTFQKWCGATGVIAAFGSLILRLAGIGV